MINRNIYVTLDEGDSFTEYHVDFSPDKFTFQYSNVPNVAKYDSYVLGYDETRQTVSHWTDLVILYPACIYFLLYLSSSSYGYPIIQVLLGPDLVLMSLGMNGAS